MSQIMRFTVYAACSASMLFVPVSAIAAAEGFTEHLLQDGFHYAYGLAAADLNGDGKPDITAADASKGELSGFVNQGDGNFARFFIKQGESGWFERHEIGDVDGDGKPDVVVVKNQSGQLLWFQNPGNPIESQTWTRNVLAADFSYAYDVSLSDINGDGRLDVAASSWIGGRFAWFENVGNNGRDWTAHIIDEGVGETRTIRAGDFNGDGRPDLLGTSRTGNLVAWYENPSEPSSQDWIKHVVDDSTALPMHGQPFDVNGNGKMDIVMAFGHGSEDTGFVVWYENLDGAGTSWARHIVGTLPSGVEAVAGDLTGDGKPELIATAWGPNGKVVWFENSGDPTAAWTMHILKEHWPKANSVLVVDLDGDNRLDIVAAAEQGSNEVRWWHNEMALAPEPDASCMLLFGLGGWVIYGWRGRRAYLGHLPLLRCGARSQFPSPLSGYLVQGGGRGGRG